jgi:hypothetical protein
MSDKGYTIIGLIDLEGGTILNCNRGTFYYSMKRSRLYDCTNNIIWNAVYELLEDGTARSIKPHDEPIQDSE